MTKRKRMWKWAGLLVAAGFATSPASAEAGHGHYPKNVIFMIPDGCDQTVVTTARWFKGADLAVDDMLAGAVRTAMADSIITDSAPAATALATGQKSSDKFLGVAPRTETLLTVYQPGDPDKAFAPLATILEAARKKGKAVGLVVTSTFTHATPAGFASHVYSRSLESSDISEQMVYNNLDVLMGGGREMLLPTAFGGKRPDGENLEQVLIDRGYQVVTTKAEMDAVTRGKLCGMFAMNAMDPDINRPILHPEQPTLAEMTAKAIEILSQDKDGFFLMVEGSQVDWAGHNNDAIWMVTDFLAFDDAVQVVKDFCDENRSTLLAGCPDHNTGGMTIGNYSTSDTYTKLKIEELVDPLKGMTATADLVSAEIVKNGGTDDVIKQQILNWWNITATEDDVTEINSLKGSVGLSYAIARVIAKNHTKIGWTTHGHNGEEVPLWLYGRTTGLAEGTIDNTALPLSVCDMWGVNLEELTARQFVNVDQVFPGEWEINRSDLNNPVLVVRGVELPFNKDYLVYEGRAFCHGGLNVYAPKRTTTGSVTEDRVFIPRYAVEFIKRIR